MKTSSVIHDDTITMMGNSNFTSKFICKLTGEESLTCYIQKPQLKVTLSSLPEDTDITKDELIQIPDFLQNISLEITFVNGGIKMYYIDYEKTVVSTSFVDLLTTLANQLNIGNDFNINDVKTKFFGYNIYEAQEENIIGICVTDYKIQQLYEGLNVTSAKMCPYTLMSYHFQIPNNASIIIEKERRMNTCREKFDYMFGAKYAYIFKDGQQIIVRINRLSYGV